MLALWLVNQLWVIVPVNPRKNRASSEKVAMVYSTIIPWARVGYEMVNSQQAWME